MCPVQVTTEAEQARAQGRSLQASLVAAEETVRDEQAARAACRVRCEEYARQLQV